MRELMLTNLMMSSALRSVLTCVASCASDTRNMFVKMILLPLLNWISCVQLFSPLQLCLRTSNHSSQRWNTIKTRRGTV